jgi:transposase
MLASIHTFSLNANNGKGKNDSLLSDGTHSFTRSFIHSLVHLFIRSSVCRPYQNYTGIDLGSAFQFAFLIRNITFASHKFNICETTFRRHFRTWMNLGQPFAYQMEETRGRDAKLTKQHSDKLYSIVSTMIMNKEFVNDFIVRRLIGRHFHVNVSASTIVEWKKRYKISSIKPSYSRVAAYNPHSEWIERQFLRDVKSACTEYDNDCIFNADETFCRTFPHTLAKVYGFTNTGRDGRQVKIDTDDKQGITCMTTVTAAGSCLSPYFVKKGTTTRCIKHFIEDNIMATFSDNGWMNESVAIKWIDDVLAPHLAGRPGCLIWDIFRAHITEGVKDHLASRNIKAIYVPASMTWKRQPLDTHIFAVIKKKYQAYYFDAVFAEKKQVKQRQTVCAYNELMRTIDPKLIVSAFKEAILTDAARVPTIADDPNPKPEEAMDVDSSQQDQIDALDDEIIVDQYEDEPLDDLSEDEIPVQMPSMRRPRQAHSVAYDAQVAHAYQSNIIR